MRKLEAEYGLRAITHDEMMDSTGRRRAGGILTTGDEAQEVARGRQPGLKPQVWAISNT